MADDVKEQNETTPQKPAKVSTADKPKSFRAAMPESTTAEPPKSSTAIDFIGIIGDIRDFVAAIKAGNWFGEDGILKIVQRMIGRIKTTGLDGAPKFSAVGDVTDAEFTNTVNEFKREMLGVAVVRGEVSALPPEIRDALIELAKKLVNVFFEWWVKRETTP